jgi:hypothetical protein
MISVFLLANLEYLSDILLFQVMGTLVTSKREVKYTLSGDMSVVQSVTAEEVHNMLVEMWQDAGSSVRATQHIALTGFVYI